MCVMSGGFVRENPAAEKVLGLPGAVAMERMLFHVEVDGEKTLQRGVRGWSMEFSV